VRYQKRSIHFVYKFACFESFTRLIDDSPSDVRKHVAMLQ